MKIYKEIRMDELNKVTIYGSNRAIQLEYRVPEWERDRAKEQERRAEPELSFRYRGYIYYLSEFMAVGPYAPSWIQEFDGYSNDSFFSGVLIKVDAENEAVKAFTFIC